jgi:hypothetical protein
MLGLSSPLCCHLTISWPLKRGSTSRNRVKIPDSRSHLACSLMSNLKSLGMKPSDLSSAKPPDKETRRYPRSAWLAFLVDRNDKFLKSEPMLRDFFACGGFTATGNSQTLGRPCVAFFMISAGDNCSRESTNAAIVPQKSVGTDHATGSFVKVASHEARPGKLDHSTLL